MKAYKMPMTQPNNATRQKGFTLIEVMIVVAIVGIVTAVAVPSYGEYIRRGHRADARAGLLQAQQWLERASTATGSIQRLYRTQSDGGSLMERLIRQSVTPLIFRRATLTPPTHW